MRLSRTWVPLALIAALGVLPLLPTVRSAEAFGARNNLRLNNHEARMLDLINQARRAAGAPALTLMAVPTDVARPWSVRLAAIRNLEHNPSMRAQLTARGCGSMSVTGENVAYDAEGPDHMFNLYMSSPGHRRNILDPRFRVIGMGSVERWQDGWPYVYNTQVFASSCAAGGGTREPAHGMHGEAATYSKRTDFMHAENGSEVRALGWVTGSGLRISNFKVDAPTTADNALRMTVNAVASLVTGSADVVLRDAMNLRDVWGITLTLAQSNPTGATVPVRLVVKQSWGPQYTLGTVNVRPGSPQAVTLAVPPEARRFMNHLVLSIPAPGIVGIATGLLSRQTTNLAVHRITFEI